MKYIFAGKLIVCAVLATVSSASMATEEQYDRCDHGATGNQCRMDVQPEHGKDCNYHGAFQWINDAWLRVGGMNEDHCRRPEE